MRYRYKAEFCVGLVPTAWRRVFTHAQVSACKDYQLP